MAKDDYPASRLMRRLDLQDGATIHHKYRRGVTGELILRGGDWYVQWSDQRTEERLHAGDVRPSR